MADGTLPPQYDPAQVEDEIYAYWEREGLFRADPNPARAPYTIVIPPPNVTGVLHMGHALNNTLQDVIIRFWRMRGREALWLPGTDHAGVATQGVVEKALWKEERKTRHDVGREGLLARIWQWKEKHGGTIVEQLKKLGCSCDWSRLRFTMDAGLSRAVRAVFVGLYREGLIYRGERLVNWSCPFQTALSDDELEYAEVDTFFWHIRYPIKGRPGRYVVVATTRPETMLGDTAVAVHPEDPRYRDLVGETAVVPLVEREVPIIADDYVKRDEGTGCLKVTPAHDPNDFAIAGRHGLRMINILNPDGTLNGHAGRFQGLDRLAARPKIVAELESLGLVEKIVPHRHSVAHCYRSHDLIEPYLSVQWYVKMAPLVAKAREAERSGRVRFHPARWTHTYRQWLDSTPDWCISRQVWWGHRIPVWTCAACKAEICETEDPAACPRCGGTELAQDPDVLDTWFSSQLWPFSTLGWPDATADLDYFYPTNLLVTDRGIIALWVARMIMAGEHFLGREPFSDVYIHATILDRRGARMSKSAGNGIDPIVMIRGGTNMDGTVFDKGFGADAVRFMLTAMTTEGQDMRIWPERFETGRNFANKIWNAARFCLMHLEGGVEALAPELNEADLDFADRWILSRLRGAIERATACAEDFRYCDFARTVYEFVWGEFCDWYLELLKPRLGDPAAAPAARRVLAFVLDRVLRILSPVTPFITEALWRRLGERVPCRPLFGPRGGPAEGPLIRAAWPEPETVPAFAGVEDEMALLQDAIRAMRELRSRYHGAPYNLSPRERLAMHISCRTEAVREVLTRRAALLAQDREANASPAAVAVDLPKPGAAAVAVRTGMTIYLPLAGLIDLKTERARLAKEREKLRAYADKIAGKLANPKFADKAPKEIVAAEKARLEEAETKLAEIEGQLRELR
ncbi:MAG TPA: valine--tRNA ligase [Planctomycetota bacterium]|jgi:valyl-tRNA synthetase|nr:valine--tRNA ligase [Planctomycetota bacterium]NMD35644.1 valine--tRNA ligase [Planctomycetota bacterium]HNS00266.1 valine--tRNA ligase [Planctomycetota bacterium]HOE31010.1 valine--tRNA ligase [Planctomycetota bacterium]HOE86885.1 valine--tRNA ligase [Planctomycetota bacterium]